MMRASLLAIGLVLATVTSLWAQQVQWRLVNADQITESTYLILTIPLDDPTVMSAISDDIETAYGVTVSAEWPLAAIAVHCLVIDASGRGDIENLIADMQDDSRIRTVQRMQSFDILSESYRDPYFPVQHALADMNIVKAHGRSNGAGVVIGVVDSAIDTAHPDLEGRLIDARDFVSLTKTGTAEDHGTAMAGVIAANADGAVGMIGVAPQSSLLGLRACWQPDGAPGRCNSFSLARAVNFAIVNDVKVLNMSIGGPPDPLLEELLQAAIQAGMVVVAATGESETKAFPASMPGVIAAGRYELGAIPAPATDVISTAPDAQYRYVSGSSVAAAHISGVVALLLAKRADLDPGAVTDALKAAMRDSKEQPMLDAYEALNVISK